MRSLPLSAIVMTFIFSPLVKAAPAKQCSGEMVVVTYSCSGNSMPEAGMDLKFYMSESQNCKDGQIVKMHRSVSAFFVKKQNNPDQIEFIDEDKINLSLAAERSMFPGRTDNLSILMPVAATVQAQEATFKLTMSNQMAPDFEATGVDQTHFVGVMQKFNKNNQLAGTVEMSCKVFPQKLINIADAR